MALFNRKNSTAPAVVAVIPERGGSSTSAAKGNTPKKGQATPKRSDAQAARRTPIVATTVTNRPLSKEEKVVQKQKQRQSRDVAYEGMKLGVEKHLPARDKGAQRRYVRQYVDARRNLAEYFMPVVVAFLIVTLFISQLGMVGLSAAFMLLFYALIIIAGIDLFLMWRKLKVLLMAKFGNIERGTAYYACMRAFQLRRMRIPLATERGVFPK